MSGPALITLPQFSVERLRKNGPRRRWERRRQETLCRISPKPGGPPHGEARGGGSRGDKAGGCGGGSPPPSKLLELHKQQQMKQRLEQGWQQFSQLQRPQQQQKLQEVLQACQRKPQH
ncbi:hypothetical protein F4821DRAFT_258944 [Hypoxylon rubiginosum]|uniref:Uncharacterized protein n=1 Tax=Hypoxylon rubiginosum TaxID=110542 RepID=A0ACC0D4D8_9PEZI|nr:hypothetical protein F4821DRAFT_258944 [Hypoxylon rubiginosum]